PLLAEYAPTRAEAPEGDDVAGHREVAEDQEEGEGEDEEGVEPPVLLELTAPRVPLRGRAPSLRGRPRHLLDGSDRRRPLRDQRTLLRTHAGRIDELSIDTSPLL